MKTIVAAHGWPTIALVGIDASNGALLMLTHSHDHAWQLSLLPQLEKLANTDKIDGSALAPVIDVQLISEGKPQRYGERFKAAEGKMEMYVVEDPVPNWVESLNELLARRPAESLQPKLQIKILGGLNCACPKAYIFAGIRSNLYLLSNLLENGFRQARRV